MKNLIIASLVVALAVISLGAKSDGGYSGVSSISFDGGKTQLHGNIIVKFYQANHKPAYVSNDGETTTVYMDVE